MSKLDEAVARACGYEIHEGKMVNCEAAYQWQPVNGWVDRNGIVEKIIDTYHVSTRYLPELDVGSKNFPESWTASVCTDGVPGWVTHKDRRTAVLMAFCKHKGVAYE